MSSQELSSVGVGGSSGFVGGSSDRVLSAIGEPGVNLALWRRSLPADHERHIGAWGAGGPPPFDRVLSSQVHDDSGIGLGMEHSLRSWLLDDIGMLVRHFVQLANTAELRVFFGAVSSNQCQKFHVDYVRLRLVSTYAGPGTEWLPDSAVNRDELAQPSELVQDANRRIVKDMREVRRAHAGEVLLMKGASAGDRHQRGAVHRSPEILGTGIHRVVLTLTALRDAV